MCNKDREGKESCAGSPTLKEEWIKEVLGEIVCENRSYDEEIVRNRIEKILIFNEYLEICRENENKIRAQLSKTTTFK